LWISPDDAAWSNSEKALIACLEARLEKDQKGLNCATRRPGSRKTTEDWRWGTAHPRFRHR